LKHCGGFDNSAVKEAKIMRVGSVAGRAFYKNKEREYAGY